MDSERTLQLRREDIEARCLYPVALVRYATIPSASIVLGVLAKEHLLNGYCDLGHQEMADRTCLSKNSIGKVIRDLEDGKVIRRERINRHLYRISINSRVWLKYLKEYAKDPEGAHARDADAARERFAKEWED
jgi:hypothetical protein